jgi:hypothetical protein
MHSTDYLITISDIVLTKSIVRSKIKQKEYPELLSERKTIAATKIQLRCRGCSQTAKYGCCDSYSSALEKICSIFQILDCPRQLNHYPGNLSKLSGPQGFCNYPVGGVGATVCLPCFCGQKENGNTRHYPYVGVEWSHFWWYRP